MMHAFLTEISQMYQGCESGDVVFRAQFTLCKIEVRRLNLPYLTNGCIESLSKKSWSFSTLVMSIGNWQSKKIKITMFQFCC